jgi:hypothetical protein
MLAGEQWFRLGSSHLDMKGLVMRSTRLQAVFALTLASALLGLAAFALAANPKPGATYAGKVRECRLFGGGSRDCDHDGHIKFIVSDNGRKVDVYHARFHTNAQGCCSVKDTNIPIKDGSFQDKGTYQDTGGTYHVRLSGDFVKHGKAAKVSLHWTPPDSTGTTPMRLKGTVHV